MTGLSRWRSQATVRLAVLLLTTPMLETQMGRCATCCMHAPAPFAGEQPAGTSSVSSLDQSCAVAHPANASGPRWCALHPWRGTLQQLACMVTSKGPLWVCGAPAGATPGMGLEAGAGDDLAAAAAPDPSQAMRGGVDVHTALQQRLPLRGDVRNLLPVLQANPHGASARALPSLQLSCNAVLGSGECSNAARACRCPDCHEPCVSQNDSSP